MRLSSAFILGWGITYIACGFLMPSIGLGCYLMLLIGCLEIMPLIFESNYPVASSYLFLFMGIAEIVGSVLSWVGMPVWSVPSFGNQAAYQVSMAFMDFAAGVILLSRADVSI